MRGLGTARFIFFLSLQIGPFGWVLAQSIENIRKRIDQDQVFITYDLVSPDPRLNYDLRIYGVYQGKRERLFRAIGAIGRGVHGGSDKEVRWSNNIEFINTPLEDIQFEFTYKFLDPPVRMLSPFSQVDFKRGKICTFKWLGGERVSIDLYKGDEKIETIAYAQEGGAFDWRVPVSLKPGHNYYIEIYGDQKEDLVKSESFTIKRRHPLWIKVIPIIALGAVVTYIVTQGENEEDGDLPPPIDPN